MRNGAPGQAARVQLRHAAADVLRLHTLERDSRIEFEQSHDVLLVVAARACREVTLVRQVIEEGAEQLAARIWLLLRRRVRRHGYKCRSNAALASSPRRLR